MFRHYFIGIKIPPTFEDLVDTYKAKYHLTEAYKVIPHPEDLHVTLLYIGAMSEQSLPLLTKKLRIISERNTPFHIRIDGLSYFGSPSGPRVIYLSIEESEVLSTLQKDIDETVAAQLNRFVSDRFTPHITIAKKRKTTDKIFIQKENWIPIEVPVSSFVLYTIHPEKYPKYEAFETFTLS